MTERTLIYRRFFLLLEVSAIGAGGASPRSFALIRLRASIRGDNGNLLASISTVSR